MKGDPFWSLIGASKASGAVVEATGLRVDTKKGSSRVLASSSPLEIRTHGPPAAAAVVRWRHLGRDQVTVVVKGTFAMAPESPMAIAESEALHPDDVHYDDDTRKSAWAASDLCPFRPKADVVMTGLVYASPEQSAAGLTVGLAVMRNDRPLVDKKIQVLGDRVRSLTSVAMRPFTVMPLVYERSFGGPGWDDNPIGTGAAPGTAEPNLVDPFDPRRTVGFGPIPHGWPARARLLGAIDPGALGRQPIDLPDGFDWSYFHAAPPDQRCEYLRGNEWIVLTNVYTAHPALRTRLPEARAIAKLYGLAGAEKGRPLRLNADTLHIDTELGRCFVTWRANVPLPADADVAKLHVAAAIEVEGQPVELPGSEPARAPSYETTMALAADDVIEVKSNGGTVGGNPSSPGVPALPFRAPEGPSPLLAPRPATPWVERPARAPEDLTVEVTSGDLSSMTLPFRSSTPATERREPVEKPSHLTAPVPHESPWAVTPATSPITAPAPVPITAPAPAATFAPVPAHTFAPIAAPAPAPTSPVAAPAVTPASEAAAAQPEPRMEAFEASPAGEPAGGADEPERYSTPESRAEARTLGALMVTENDDLDRFLARHVAKGSGLDRADLVRIRDILRGLARGLAEGGDGSSERIKDAWILLHEQPRILRERRRPARKA